MDLHDLQPKIRVEAVEILGIARDNALPIDSSANDDTRVHRIGVPTPTEQQPCREGGARVERNSDVPCEQA